MPSRWCWTSGRHRTSRTASLLCKAHSAGPNPPSRRIPMEEIESIRVAGATLDDATMAAYVGLNGAIARCAALETNVAEAH